MVYELVETKVIGVFDKEEDAREELYYKSKLNPEKELDIRKGKGDKHD